MVIDRDDLATLVEWLDSKMDNYDEVAIEEAVITLPSGVRVRVTGESRPKEVNDVALTVTV